MAVLIATDADIASYQEEPAVLEALLNRVISARSDEMCNLSDSWDALHFLLTSPDRREELPMAALKKGEVTFRGLSDPAHAIYSDTARRWSTEMDALGNDTLRERFDRGLARRAADYPSPRGLLGRMWGVHAMRPMSPRDIDEAFRELAGFLDLLRHFSARAVAHASGLVFCRWEDW